MSASDDIRYSDSPEVALNRVRRELERARTTLARRAAAHADRHATGGADPIPVLATISSTLTSLASRASALELGGATLPFFILDAEEFAIAGTTNTRLRWSQQAVSRCTFDNTTDIVTLTEGGKWLIVYNAAIRDVVNDCRFTLHANQNLGAGEINVGGDDRRESFQSWTWGICFTFLHLAAGTSVYSSGWAGDAGTVSGDGRQHFIGVRLMP